MDDKSLAFIQAAEKIAGAILFGVIVTDITVFVAFVIFMAMR